MSRNILVLVSEYGYWGEELVGPLEIFDGLGWRSDICTPTGKRPVAITVSMDPGYLDPPLGRPVTTPEMAAKVRALDGSPRLDNPRDLSQWFPERPYYSDPDFLPRFEAYHRRLSELAAEVERSYDSVILVGGSGAIVDMVNNWRVHDLVLAFYKVGKPIAAECYGITCLAFARDIRDRRSILSGKHVTGHCLEYDYKHGYGFMGTDFVIGTPPYPLEYILRDATAPDGEFHGNFGWETSVVVDYPFVTGRTTNDATLVAQKLVEVLESGLRQWGFGAHAAPVASARTPTPAAFTR